MDLEAETWKALPDMRYAALDHCSVAYNNKLYIIGGS